MNEIIVNKFGNTFPTVRGFWLLLCAFALMCCRSDDNSSNNAGITGKWRLVEVLLDPGDGSGMFSPVESEKEINILEDGTYSSNGEICDLSIIAESASQGTIMEDTQGYFLTCEEPLTANVRLGIEDGDLILTFFCIEPCQQKYQRTN